METNKKLLETLEQDPDVAFLKNEYPDVWRPVGKAIEKVAANADERIETISKRIEQHNREEFYNTLDKDIEGWETVNTSSEFKTWLQGKDGYTGLTRQQLLIDAYGQYDAERAKVFFRNFLEEATPNTDRSEQSVKKDTQQQPEITRAEIQKFYRDVEHGYYTGIEDERLKEEARIEKAIEEGRVV